jgi:chlorobactene glucosyltransferase
MDLVALCCSSIWLLVVVVLIARAARQRGLLPRLVSGSPPSREVAPSVAVIVPARDEAANIEACLQTLLAQDYPQERCALVVVDDQSADSTPQIVAALAHGRPRLRLVRSTRLPHGWTGKSHACWTGFLSVAAGSEWLCFVDADMRAEPGLLASALRTARDRRLDLLSVAPRQVLGSFAERLIIPSGLFILAFVQNLRALQSCAGRDVAATGQFMLVRVAAYAAIGGHAAVHAAISEDLELARRCKRAGHKVLLMDGARALSTRMYGGWRDLWEGFAKNVVDMLGGPRATAATALASVVAAWATLLVPAFAIYACLDHPGTAALLALAAAVVASAAIGALHVAGAIHFRIPFWYGLIFPLGYTAGALLAIDSIRRRHQGRVAWKGRIYP